MRVNCPMPSPVSREKAVANPAVSPLRIASDATVERLNIPTVFYLSDHWIARGLQADVWLNWWTGPAGSGSDGH